MMSVNVSKLPQSAGAAGVAGAADESATPDFESVKRRLAEIADAVSDDSLPLDDALDLYEEAVALGLKASDLLEVGVQEAEGDDEASAGKAEQPAPAGDAAPDRSAPAPGPAERPGDQA